MSELDNLRPEVRDAVVGADKAFNHTGLSAEPYWQTIRAELLRLADECAMIPRAQLLANFAAANERAEKAEADLATAQNTINAQQGTMGALKQKLALSEGELAALKARIAGSDAGIVTQTFSHLGSDGADTTTVEAYPPKVFHHTAIGQRVRLVDVE